MTANKKSQSDVAPRSGAPEMPEAQLLQGLYGYTPADMQAIRDAGYLAGLRAAGAALPIYEKPNFASPSSPLYEEGHEDGFNECRTKTLANLRTLEEGLKEPALEQEAKK